MEKKVKVRDESPKTEIFFVFRCRCREKKKNQELAASQFLKPGWLGTFRLLHNFF
jgi:GTP cyclohydrolase II